MRRLFAALMIAAASVTPALAQKCSGGNPHQKHCQHDLLPPQGAGVQPQARRVQPQARRAPSLSMLTPTQRQRIEREAESIMRELPTPVIPFTGRAR